MRTDGYSLIELLVILAFVGIILLIATPLTLENIRRARAENEAQTIYSNIAEARQRALQRNLNYILQIKQDSVNIFEDRNNNNTAENSERVDLLSTGSLGKLSYLLQGNVGGTAIGASAVTATSSRKGFIQPNTLIYLDQQTDLTGPAKGIQEGRHNCISIDFTRVSIGKYNGTTCQVQ